MSVGVLMSVTVVAFQSLGVGTVMPAVARELDGLERYGWAFSAFMLASLVGSVAAGQDADRAGPVRAYVAAVASFAVGSVLAAAAGRWDVLLADWAPARSSSSPTPPRAARTRRRCTGACWR